MIWRSLLQKQASCSPDELPLSLSLSFLPPLPSVVHLSISMLMPCNDLRHVGMKEEERNLFSAHSFVVLFCCCCYSNTVLELKLTQQCLFAWQDGVIFLLCTGKKRVGVNYGKKGGVGNSYTCCVHVRRNIITTYSSAVGQNT